MAGSQDAADNPVAVNVVPMVDVIFCLCVFFMCSFKFKQLEGRFDTWLPKTKGAEGVGPKDSLPPEIRIAMLWDEANGKSVRKGLTRVFPGDDSLQRFIREQRADYALASMPDVPVTIDADARVPWADVVDVVNLARREGAEHVEFAFGGPHR